MREQEDVDGAAEVFWAAGRINRNRWAGGHETCARGHETCVRGDQTCVRGVCSRVSADIKHSRLSDGLGQRPTADRVVSRYNELLDSGTVCAATGQAGGVALSTFAQGLCVPPRPVWR